MVPTRFVAAYLRTSKDATVAVRALAVGRTRASATRIARGHLEENGDAVVVFSPRRRSLDVWLPTAVGDLRLGQISELEAHIALWLTAMRADGALRLGELVEAGDELLVPPCWLTDPRVLACLAIVLAPAAPRTGREHQDVEAWLDAAADGSIAALLRESDLRYDFTEWVEAVPPKFRAHLRMSLYSVGSNPAGGLCVGLVLRHDPFSPFLTGYGWQWDVVGWCIERRPRAMRRDEDWQLVDPALLPQVDQAWNVRGDPRVDRLFKHLPVLVEAVLHDAASAAVDAGAPARRVLGGLPRFRRRAAAMVREQGSAISARLLRDCGLEGLAEPRLSHARFLQASGNSTVARRRLQAAVLWPALASDLAQETAPRTTWAIDQGRPLSRALGHDYRVPKWVIRRLLPLLALGNSQQTLIHRAPAEMARLIFDAGPHAPPLVAADLAALERWQRLLPDSSDQPWTRLLMQGLGAEAARGGWSAVAALLEGPEIGDDAMALLAWWRDLSHNVRDAIGGRSGSQPNSYFVEETLLAWCEGLPMAALLRYAVGWRELLWGAGTDGFDTQSYDLCVQSVFGPLSLCDSQVVVTPLVSPDALHAEGADMQNCVGSYWGSVASARRLVCSLSCPTSGERGTVAWAYLAAGGWERSEARGRRNSIIYRGTVLAAALEELGNLLADETRQHGQMLANHRSATPDGSRRATDCLVDGACLVSLLPAGLARVALRCMPGVGGLEDRVRFAARRVARRQTRFTPSG